MNSFNLGQYLDQQVKASTLERDKHARDIRRLTMAAWGVGGTHADFRALPRAQQVAKVNEWVSEAMEHAEQRRSLKFCRS